MPVIRPVLRNLVLPSSDSWFGLGNKLSVLGAANFLYDCYNICNIISDITDIKQLIYNNCHLSGVNKWSHMLVILFIGS